MGESIVTIEELKREGLWLGGALNLNGTLIFEEGVRIYGGVTVINSKIGAYSYLNAGVRLFNVSMGRYCSIGQEVIIGLNRHPTDWVTSSPVSFDRNVGFPPTWQGFKPPNDFNAYPDLVTIEDDVWIGTRAIISANRPLTIGRGSIIATGSIVTKDVEPYSIVGGNPARHIRSRFSASIIHRLQLSQWWKYDFYRYIHDNLDNPLSWEAPDKFLNWLEIQEQNLSASYILTGILKKAFVSQGNIEVMSI
jgi:acetyltransferase-like isoleucine patch superfamily enzyme